MFPNTRMSLIQRLAQKGDEQYWSEFLGDYWRPVCRFAIAWGRLQLADAEDVAAETFEILIRNQILLRWTENQSAKLRTLLCSIVRKQLANRRRVHVGRNEKFASIVAELQNARELEMASLSEESAAFRKLWIDELLQQSLDALRDDYISEGKVDRFRVLYGRVCEGASHAEIAKYLNITVTTSESWLKEARDRLSDVLRVRIRHMVVYNSDHTDIDGEFEREWTNLGECLLQTGGLEPALRRSHEVLSEFSRHASSGSQQSELTRRLVIMARETQNP